MEEFLNLGQQPLANGFLREDQIEDEYFYHLKYAFDPETKLVSMVEKPEPRLMFNESYPYHSSGSTTMVEHFKSIADKIKDTFNPTSILEIGSNDGVFINYFPKETAVCVEPCSNFAKITEDLGYKTYSKFWSTNLAGEIYKEHGTFNIIYSANCMCHIPDIESAIAAVSMLMEDYSIFVFEDPSLLKMINKCSYDELYDEHQHMFSVTALDKLLGRYGLRIFRVESLPVHGGSNRIWATKDYSISQERSFYNHLFMEKEFGLNKFDTYKLFGEAVRMSKYYLQEIMFELVSSGHRIFSYGATSKSTTIFNFCKFNDNHILFITDTTKDKQGKLSPGMHIPVISPEEGFGRDFDGVFLGAWNYIDEIVKREKERMKGKYWITHVPFPRVLGDFEW